MNTTVQALQALYVKLGGSLTDTYDDIANGATVADYATIPDMVDAIAEVTESGGDSSLPSVSATDNGNVLTVVDGAWSKAPVPAELPETTSSDNGDVLKVVNGEWEKAAESATSGMIVTFTASGGTYSADKTLSEITEAWTSTKNVIGYNSETGYVLPCVLANSELAIFSATALTAASTYTAMSMQVTASSGLIYEQENVELASS